MDIEGLKSYLNCDNTFLASLIQKFMDEVGGITSLMEEAGKKGDWPVIKAGAHKMLSSVRIFELTELIEVLEQLEIEAAEPNDTNKIRTDLERMRSLVGLTMKDMHTTLEELS
jgi:HPt (histidine-containing phosphotransfer) domain-containing protein